MLDLKPIKDRLLMATKQCYCGLPQCQDCIADEDLIRNAKTDLTYLIAEVEKLREALEVAKNGLKLSEELITDEGGDGSEVHEALSKINEVLK